MQTLRIFISSPGDVAEERDRARQVVESLRRRYAERLCLKPVLWEELPLQADMSFQQGIDLVLSREHGVDIAVFILWSRLGSPVGAVIPKPDGGTYRSGTEREFDLMLTARKQSREANSEARPHVLIYTRRDEVSFEERLRGKSTNEKDQLIQQKKLVEGFLTEEFKDAGTGTNIRAYHSFDRPVTFSQRLRAHLTELLDEVAGDGIGEAVWDIEKQGPPFLGLEAFQPVHADVFFGREDEILEVRHALREQARNGCAFVLLSGASGSGKSSLARAGVLPAIVENEVDEQVTAWRTVIVTPSELAPDPIASLVRLLAADDVLPELRGDEGSLDDLADVMRRNPADAFKLRIKPALSLASQRVKGAVRLLLVLDQLEELFASAAITADSRSSFLAVIETLACSGSVWVIATARSDFNPQLQTEPALVRMASGLGTLVVSAPGPDDLRRLIEEPARLAGLHFEQRDGHALSDRILRDAAAHPELLPLVEYVLRELFEQRTHEGRLTFALYEQLGGVEGALAKRAETVFTALPGDAQECLGTVLKSLVTLGQEGEKTVTGAAGEERLVRQRAPLTQFPENSPARALVEAFVKERLFTTAEHPQTHEASLTLAHESLLRVWPRAVAWAANNRDFLRSRLRLRTALIAWQQEKTRRADLLLPQGKPLEDALALAKSHAADLSSEELGFIRESAQHHQERERRVVRRRQVAFAALSGLTVLALAAGILAYKNGIEANAQRDTSEARRIEADKQKTRADQARDKALAAKKSADELINFMQYDLRDSLGKLGRLDMMQSINDRIAKYQKDHPPEEGDAEALREQGAMSSDRGDLLLAQGDLKGALERYRKSNAIAERLAEQDPCNTLWQLDLSMSYRKLGDALAAAGDGKAALECYRKEFATAERLAQQDPGKPAWQGELSASYVRLGDALSTAGDGKAALESYRKSSAVHERLAKQDPDHAIWQQELSAIYNKIGAALNVAGDGKAALESYRKSLAIIERLAQQDPGNAGWQWDLSVSYDNVGVALNAAGDRQAALESYRKEFAIVERLAQQDPDNAGWQRSLSASYNKLGEALAAAGDGKAALEFYRNSLAIRERLAKQDPGNAGSQRGLYVSYVKIGDVLVAAGDGKTAMESYSKALAIIERLALKDPRNAGWQRELSTSYGRIGDALAAAVDGKAALESYRKSLAIIERLAQQDPGNAGWQGDLSVSYDNLGVALNAAGDGKAALESYRKSLAILERLTQQDPSNAGLQRSLSVSYVHVGVVLAAAGDGKAALESYRKCLTILERLAQHDPGNATWQWDLSISYDRIGNALTTAGDGKATLEFYRKSLAIRERLAEHDPGNAACQRNLSVSYEKIGTALSAAGDGKAAMEDYRKSLAIRERLAQQDPGNAGWQRDLSISYSNIGDALATAGDNKAALESYRKEFAIVERLAQQDPGNAGRQRDLSDSYNNIGDALVAAADAKVALESYRKALMILERLAQQEPGDAPWQWGFFISYCGISQALEKTGDLPGALQQAEAALKISEKLSALDPTNAKWQADMRKSRARVAELRGKVK